MIELTTRAALVTLYSEPQRHYHNITHIYHCLREFVEFTDCDDFTKDHVGVDFFSVEKAIWFHDCVYDPQAKDNEKQSADVAHGYMFELARQIPAARDKVLTVCNMILLTANHMEKEELSPSEKVFLDIDLAILGASESAYNAYAANIQKEYSFVPRELYKPGRAKLLGKFLSSPRIFRTEYFHKKYEKIARDNIQREINALTFEDDNC